MCEKMTPKVDDVADQALTGINTTRLGKMSKKEKVRRMESDIREMAALDHPKWPMWENG